MAGAPSRATVHRVLVRNAMVTPQAQRHNRKYRRWQRETPMGLWQLDLVGGIYLADGREGKLLSGIDDHSRYVAVAAVLAVPESEKSGGTPRAPPIRCLDWETWRVVLGAPSTTPPEQPGGPHADGNLASCLPRFVPLSFPPAVFGIFSGMLRTFADVGMVFSFAVAIPTASRAIPRSLAFAIFVGTTSLHGHLAAAFTTGLHAAFYTLMAFMIPAATLSAVRGQPGTGS